MSLNSTYTTQNELLLNNLITFYKDEKYLNRMFLAKDSSFPDKISEVTCRVSNSNNIPVFLNFECLALCI